MKLIWFAFLAVLYAFLAVALCNTSAVAMTIESNSVHFHGFWLFPVALWAAIKSLGYVLRTSDQFDQLRLEEQERRNAGHPLLHSD